MGANDFEKNPQLVKVAAARRHPLQVTADRLQQHLKEYRAQFDNTVDQAAFDRVIRRLTNTAEDGVEAGGILPPAYGPPVNTGASVDQRVKR